MKRIITMLCCALSILISIHAQNKPAVAQNANTTLSNLTSPTLINVNLVPDKNNNRNLGNATKAWKNLYLDTAVYIGGYKFIKGNGQDLNVSLGIGALDKTNPGQRNIALGYTALELNTGYDNTAIGTDALSSNGKGLENVSIGGESMSVNTTGNQNTAVGYEALQFSKTGSSNTAVGYRAGGFIGDLNNTVAIGALALVDLQDGADGCTAVGTQAGYSDTHGNHNTYLGYHAGNTVYDGGSNTIIGYGADVSGSAFNNATAVGNYAVAGGSNHIRIGNSAVTSIGGAVAWTNFSDERIKKNIKQDVPGLAFINLLKPVTYNFDLNKEEQIFKRKDSADWQEKFDIQKIKFTGFLAQEVEAAAKKINYDFSGVDKPSDDKDVYGLRYSDFVVPLVKAVQELSAQNDSLQNQNLIQQKINADLQHQINDLKVMIVGNLSTGQQSTAISSASLSQNIPNPFSNSTIINYSLPQHYSSAKIIITDKNGNALKTISLSNNKGFVNVDAVTLSSGAYQYSLYVDGKLVATKQMEKLK